MAAAREAVAATAPRARTRLRVSVLGWLVAVEGLAMLATVLFQSRPLGAVLGVGMLAALAANLLIAPRRLRGLSAEWSLPKPVHVDDEVALAALVRAEGGVGPLRLASADDEMTEHKVVASIAGADAAGTRATWTTRFATRGAHQLAPLEARTDQPFGLAEARRVVSRGAELIVLPAIGQLKRALRQRLGEWLEATASGLERGDDELSHLRAYRPGDPPRAIHWRATARHRALLVAERSTPLDRTVALVVDLDVGGRRLERVIAIAATLVDHLLGGGWRLTLHGAFSAGGVHGDRQVLLESLALAERAAGDVLERLPRDRAAIVLSAREISPPAGGPPVLVLPLSDAERLVRLPPGRRSG